MIIDPHKAESLSGKAMQMSDPYLVTNRQMRLWRDLFSSGNFEELPSLGVQVLLRVQEANLSRLTLGPVVVNPHFHNSQLPLP